jgi:hypothetical protein
MIAHEKTEQWSHGQGRLFWEVLVPETCTGPSMCSDLLDQRPLRFRTVHDLADPPKELQAMQAFNECWFSFL